MFKSGNIGAIVYFVSDLDQSEKFYRDVLGLEITRVDDEAEGSFLQAQSGNGVELVFFAMEVQQGQSPVVVFDVPDGGIDDVVQELSEKGVTIVTPVSHAPGGWSADFVDPDGHVLSMYQGEDKPRSLR